MRLAKLVVGRRANERVFIAGWRDSRFSQIPRRNEPHLVLVYFWEEKSTQIKISYDFVLSSTNFFPIKNCVEKDFFSVNKSGIYFFTVKKK